MTSPKFTQLFLLSMMIIFSQSGLAGSSQITGKQKILSVELSIEAPFSSAKISIFPEGATFVIRYTSESPKTGLDLTEKTKEIPPVEWDKLTRMIQEAEFWSLKEKYVDEYLMDATEYTLMVRSVPDDGRMHLRFPGSRSLTCQEGMCPANINRIIKEIKDLWGSPVAEIGV